MSITAAYMVPHPPLIIPEVGRGQERGISDTIQAYHKIAQEIAQIKPELIIVITPHSVMYRDYIHISPGQKASGDFGDFLAGQVRIEADYDTEFVQELAALAGQKGFPAGVEGEQSAKLDHAFMIPLYFINQYYRDYKTVRIGLSGLSLEDHYTFGTYIQRTAESLGRETVLIASGDLSHYLKDSGPYSYHKEGPEYDSKIMDVMSRADFKELLEFSEGFLNKAGECGHRSFTIMAGALDGRQVKGEKLSYEGPFGVGYGICSYHVTEQKMDAYAALARRSLETYIRTGEMLDVPEGLPDEMLHKRAGVFVSIKKNNMLRGCIGTILPVQDSIAREIIENAVSAGVHDPRFQTVAEIELPHLVYSVDVLGEPEKIDRIDQLDVKRYGVIVTKGWRRGLLLPNLEGVDSVEEQVAIARQKAGISEDEPVSLERFEVVRHR